MTDEGITRARKLIAMPIWEGQDTAEASRLLGVLLVEVARLRELADMRGEERDAFAAESIRLQAIADARGEKLGALGVDVATLQPLWAECHESGCGWTGEMSQLVERGSLRCCPACGSTAIKEDIAP